MSTLLATRVVFFAGLCAVLAGVFLLCGVAVTLIAAGAAASGLAVILGAPASKGPESG